MGTCVAVSQDGNTVALLAPTIGTGSVSVFDWNGSTWVLRGVVAGTNTGDKAGKAVALSDDGNRVVIGSYTNDDFQTNAGYVRIFDWNEIAFAQVGNAILGTRANGWFGYSVAINAAGTIAIGGPYTGPGVRRGLSRVYCYNVGRAEWIQVGGEDIIGTPIDRDGSAVALARGVNIIAIGATNFGTNATPSVGQVRVFELEDPFMRIYGNGTLIANVDLSPATTDHSDFGGVPIVSGRPQVLLH
jgi:hypothetical protein